MKIAGIILAAALASAWAVAQAATSAPDAAPAQTLTRPADLDKWTTLGTTLRMSPTAPAEPNQFRHIQLKPGAFVALQRDRAYPDGAVFAGTFYSVRRDEGEKPTLYAQDKEVAFALEVLDKRHPDGRRFYMFAPGATTATPLPAGNACAACHNAKGDLQGTFSGDYPLTAPYAHPSAK